MRVRRTLLAASVLAAALIGTASPPAGATPTLPPTGTIPHAAVCTGSMTDATTAIQTWVDSLPNGTHAQLEPGCYRVEGTITIDTKAFFVFDGDGSTFRSFTARTGNQPHIVVEDSSAVRIEDLTVDGGQDPIYSSTTAGEHAFAVDGGNYHVTLERVAANRVLGSFVHVADSDTVIVTDSRFGTDDDPVTADGSGRQGIGISSGTDISVTDSEVSNARWSILNLTPRTSSDAIDGVTFARNTVRHTRAQGTSDSFVASQALPGLPTSVEDLDVSDNTLIGRKMWVSIEEPTAALDLLSGPGDYTRREYRFVGNRSDAFVGRGGSGAAFHIQGVYDVEIRDNHVPVGTDGSPVPAAAAGLVDFKASHTTQVIDNTAPTGDGNGTNDYVARYAYAPAYPSTNGCESYNMVDSPARVLQTSGIPECGPTPSTPPNTVPSSPTCDPNQADATTALANWLHTVAYSGGVAKLDPVCYRVDGTIVIRDRDHFVFDGTGATFARFGTVSGTKQFVRVTGSDDTVVRGLHVDAGLDPDYDPLYEHQHAFSVDGRTTAGTTSWPGSPNDGVSLRGVSADRVLGDFVYVHTSTDVEVVGARFGNDSDPLTVDGSGRQGVAVVSGNDVTVHHSEVSGAARSILDLEPNVLADEIRGVTFAHNLVGQNRPPGGDPFVASKGKPSAAIVVQDLDISYNTLVGRPMWISFEEPDDSVLATLATPADYGRRHYRIVGNTSDTFVGRWYDSAAIHVHGVHDIEIRGNTVPIGADSNPFPAFAVGLVAFRASDTIRLIDNTAPPGDGNGTNDYLAKYTALYGPSRPLYPSTNACESGNQIDSPLRAVSTVGIPSC